MLRLGILLLVTVQAIGCATVSKGTRTNFKVVTPEVPDVDCVVTDGKGNEYLVVSDEVVEVRKSKNAIKIVCEKDGYKKNTSQVEPIFEAKLFQNLALSGGISPIWVAVDNFTGAHWELPEKVSIYMEPRGLFGRRRRQWREHVRELKNIEECGRTDCSKPPPEPVLVAEAPEPEATPEPAQETVVASAPAEPSRPPVTRPTTPRPTTPQPATPQPATPQPATPPRPAVIADREIRRDDAPPSSVEFVRLMRPAPTATPSRQRGDGFDVTLVTETGDFYLMAGTFGRWEHAKARMESLARIGVPSHTHEDVEAEPTRYHVHVGEFATREDALNAERFIRTNSRVDVLLAKVRNRTKEVRRNRTRAGRK